MSSNDVPATASHRLVRGASRVVRAWRGLSPERRLVAYASVVLFVTLFLPWYQRHFFIVVSGKLQPAADSQTGWGAFSFVQAALLLLAAGVLTLLFRRAEGRQFRVPGGDGITIMGLGILACLLVIWGIFNEQGATSQAQNATTYGIEWGIFIALGAAAFLTYAGNRVRVVDRPAPGAQAAQAARDREPWPAGPAPAARQRELERTAGAAAEPEIVGWYANRAAQRSGSRQRPNRPVQAPPQPRNPPQRIPPRPRIAADQVPPRPRIPADQPSPETDATLPLARPAQNQDQDQDATVPLQRAQADPWGHVPDWTPGPDQAPDLRIRRRSNPAPEISGEHKPVRAPDERDKPRAD